MGKASQSGGVKPMSIAGRYGYERERLIGMTDAERAFRKQWLKDQELAPNEPRHVPEIYKATNNPIRRFYKWPLNTMQTLLTPIVGSQRAASWRMITGKAAIGVGVVYWMWYYLKYNSNSWEKKTGVKIMKSRQAILPGDPGYPRVDERTKGSDYASKGFNKITLNL